MIKPHGTNLSRLSRRHMVGASLAVGALAVCRWTPAALAAMKRATPPQSPGAFYAPFKPLSIDNDLAVAPGGTERAQGRLIYVLGRVLDQTGKPVRGARVEIWHANKFGRYSHPRHQDQNLPRDPNFQGYGHDLVNDSGGYRFRTIKPGPFPASPTWVRPPHIHFAIFAPGSDPWTTQMYFSGEPLNDTDPILNGVGDPAGRAVLVVDLQPPSPELEPESAVAVFDIVLGSSQIKASAAGEWAMHRPKAGPRI
ncbi:MAG: protocatechuate 3,4-dioxygenase subunit beta [Kiloniellales bacterium]